MSLLNYLGKVKTTFVPYTSKYQDGKMYPHTYTGNDSFLRTKEKVELFGSTGFTTMKNKSGIYNPYIYYTDSKHTKKTILFDLDDRLFCEILHFEKRPCSITQASVSREYIVRDFPEVIKKITNSYTTPILSTLNIPQMFTLSELLSLKVDDVDSRVDHLEKMLAQVIDDNKLLQRLVNDLECRIENLELS